MVETTSIVVISKRSLEIKKLTTVEKVRVTSYEGTDTKVENPEQYAST